MRRIADRADSRRDPADGDDRVAEHRRAAHPPIIPPLSIVAGYAVVHIWRTSRDAFGRAALIALLAWLFIGVGKEHPDYLPWFNEAAQPNPSWVAADSNIDWGQDVLRLARVVEEMKIDHLHSRS